MELRIKAKPSKKQAEVYKYLRDHKTEYILAGGASSGGKSWIGCEWLLISALSFPGTVYAICRNELKAIRETTLQTFYKVMRFHNIAADSVMKYNAVDHYMQFFNGSKIVLLDIGDLPSDPFFERVGSYDLTSAWLEEAGEISEAAFDAIKSRINRCGNDKYNILGKILITANPKKNWCFYNFVIPFEKGTLGKNKAYVQMLVDDNPYRESGVKQKLEGITDSVKRDRLLHGNWHYSEEAGQLIPTQYINEALTSNATLVERGEYFITCDVSRFGSDSTVLVLFSGMRAEQIHTYKHLSTTETAEKIKELQERYGVSIRNIIADEDGVGGGVVDQLGCVGFLNGSKPLEVSGKVDNYANLKTQCYYQLAEYFKEKKIYINCANNTDLKNKLIQELEQVRLKDSDTENKITIASKKEVKQRIGRSPDISDAIMMRMYWELQPVGQPVFTFHRHGNSWDHLGKARNRDNVVTIGRNDSSRRDYFTN